MKILLNNFFQTFSLPLTYTPLSVKLNCISSVRVFVSVSVYKTIVSFCFLTSVRDCVSFRHSRYLNIEPEKKHRDRIQPAAHARNIKMEFEYNKKKKQNTR